MESNYPPQIVPAIPDFVLSVIVDNHRQQSQFDPEADPIAVLTFDTTVAEWRNACDLVDWRRLGRALNDNWKIDCSKEQWKSVLVPPRQRKLLDVCNLIAAEASREVIRPVALLGRPCATAGAFLTVRHFLQKAGADADAITPSTPLAPFLRNYYGVFLGPVSCLAPNTLPPVKIRSPLYWGSIAGYMLSWLLMAFCSFMMSRYLWWCWGTMLSAAAMAIFYALIWIAAKSRPASVEFGNLKTFRDLAKCLAVNSME
jgi:hypothetical protein